MSDRCLAASDPPPSLDHIDTAKEACSSCDNPLYSSLQKVAGVKLCPAEGTSTQGTSKTSSGGHTCAAVQSAELNQNSGQACRLAALGLSLTRMRCSTSGKVLKGDGLQVVHAQPSCQALSFLQPPVTGASLPILFVLPCICAMCMYIHEYMNT